MLPAVLISTAVLTAIIVLRYLAVAGWVFWLTWGRAEARRGGVRLNRTEPSRARIRHELTASLIAAPIYALPAAAAMEAWRRGGTLIYMDVGRYGGPAWGWAYLLASAAAYLLLHDAYYYWAHRLMHRPALFGWSHAGHHRSKEPTAFASFSFDAAEAALTGWFVPALTFLIPIQGWALMALLMLMTVSAALNHSGYELMPRAWVRGPFGAGMISATHHSLHHRRPGCNFGLYFRFWDRLMGTDALEPPAGVRR